MEVARAGDVLSVLRLLAAGADPAATDRSARTAAGHAAAAQFALGRLLLLPGPEFVSLLRQSVRTSQILGLRFF